MNLGFFIALIFFIVFGYLLLSFFFNVVLRMRGPGMFWDVFPQMYVNIISEIDKRLIIFCLIVLTITCTVILVLFIIWYILKHLPWPLNELAKTPPLNELEEAGVFKLYERIFDVMFSFEWIHIKFREYMLAINEFMKEFLIKVFEEYNPTVANRLKDIPSKKIETTRNESSSGNKKIEIKNNSEKYLIDKMGSIIEKNVEQCIRKNTEQITPDMSIYDVYSTSLMNRFNNIQCQLKAIEPNIKINITNNML